MCEKKRTPEDMQEEKKARPSPEADGSVTIPVDSESTEEETETPAEEDIDALPEDKILFALSKENDQLTKENERLAAALEAAEAEMEPLRAKAEQYDQAVRSISVYDEQRKRAEKARDEALNFGSAGLLKELIPVRDNMTRALEASERVVVSINDIQVGLKGIIKEMDAALENAGLETIEPAKGEPMDPNAHRATVEVPTPMPGFHKGDVMEVQQRGYMLRGRILRYADVIVAGADAAEPVEAEEPTEVAPEGDLPKERGENSTEEAADQTDETAESVEENSTEEAAEEPIDNETEA